MLLSPNTSSKNLPDRPAWIPLLALGLGGTLLAPVSCASSPTRAPESQYGYTFAPDPTQRAGLHGDANRGEMASPANAQREAVAVSGRLEPEVIRKTVREHYPAFGKCYESLPAPLTATEVEMRFTIGNDGKVTEGSTDAKDRKALGACVESAMFAMVFPQPVGGVVTVVYTLQLAPASD